MAFTVFVDGQEGTTGLRIHEMLARRSDEGAAAGLGWIDAEVKRLDPGPADTPRQLPHMGWNAACSIWAASAPYWTARICALSSAKTCLMTSKAARKICAAARTSRSC